MRAELRLNLVQSRRWKYLENLVGLDIHDLPGQMPSTTIARRQRDRVPRPSTARPFDLEAGVIKRLGHTKPTLWDEGKDPESPAAKELTRPTRQVRAPVLQV